MRLRVAVCNVPISVGAKAWRECFTETAKRGDIFGINESFDDDQRDVFIDEARERRLRQFGVRKSPNPVFSNPRVWRRRHGSVYKLHGRGPLYHVWRGFNEARYATVTVNKPAPRRKGPVVTFVAPHLVPRGPKVRGWWRNRVRNRSLKILADIIKAHVKRGRVVVIAGDFNMDDAPDLPGVRWLVGATHGVDKIGVACPDGWRLGATSTYRFPAPTDHKSGVAADLRIERVR